MADSTSPSPGWYPDPSDPTLRRRWDGSAWTSETAPLGGDAPAAAQEDAGRFPGESSSAYAPPPSSYGSASAYAPPSDGNEYPAGATAPGAYPSNAYPGAPEYAYGAAPYGAIGVWRGPIDDRPVVTNPVAALKVVLSKYAQFDGRASRPEYWWFALASAIIFTVLYALAFSLGLSAVFVGENVMNIGPALVFLALFGLVGLALFVPGLAVAVRRLRDAGLHWAWIFITFAPLGQIVLIILLVQPSKFPER